MSEIVTNLISMRLIAIQSINNHETNAKTSGIHYLNCHHIGLGPYRMGSLPRWYSHTLSIA